MLVELSYVHVCILSLLQLLIWISYLDILPEAICCCLQTYTVNDVLLVMYCMCLPAFFVTSADKSQIFMLFTNISPEAICCLETFNVYVVLLCGVVDVVLHNCSQTFMITCANISCQFIA